MTRSTYPGDRYSLIPARILPHLFIIWLLMFVTVVCGFIFIPLSSPDGSPNMTRFLIAPILALCAGTSLLNVGLGLMNWKHLSLSMKLMGIVPLLVITLFVCVVRAFNP